MWHYYTGHTLSALCSFFFLKIVFQTTCTKLIPFSLLKIKSLICWNFGSAELCRTSTHNSDYAGHTEAFSPTQFSLKIMSFRECLQILLSFAKDQVTYLYPLESWQSLLNNFADLQLVTLITQVVVFHPCAVLTCPLMCHTCLSTSHAFNTNIIFHQEMPSSFVHHIHFVQGKCHFVMPAWGVRWGCGSCINAAYSNYGAWVLQMTTYGKCSSSSICIAVLTVCSWYGTQTQPADFSRSSVEVSVPWCFIWNTFSASYSGSTASSPTRILAATFSPQICLLRRILSVTCGLVLVL